MNALPRILARFTFLRCLALLGLTFSGFASAALPTGVASSPHDNEIQDLVATIKTSGTERLIQSQQLLDDLRNRLQKIGAPESDNGFDSQAVVKDLLEVIQMEAKGLSTVNLSHVRSLRSEQTSALTFSASTNPTAYNFGDVATGSSASTTVTITNTGTSTLTFSYGYPAVTVGSGPSSSMIKNGTTCSNSLLSGQSCTVDVLFSASASGSYSGYVFARFNEFTDLSSSSLSGFGTGGGLLSASITPTSYNFGNVATGSSASTTVTITNTGTSTLTFSYGYPAVTVGSGPSSSMIKNGTTCSNSLLSGQSCTVDVLFSASASVSYSGYVFARFNEFTDLSSTTLSGYGTPGSIAPVCTLSAAPAKVRKGETSTLTASCTPAATTYLWTGGTCEGATTSTCTVTPAATTTYSVTGTNSYGSSTANVQVTVKAVDLTPILMLLLD